jgi:hypothetical protein
MTTKTSPVVSRPLEIDEKRRLIQDSSVAIRDLYAVLVELVTNVDDRYQVLDCSGKIEIELARRSAPKKPTILRVRDFADGMTSEVMDLKIGKTGGRVSGLEKGLAVRGTNSRGAKDIAALGKVMFESIANDSMLHKCKISPRFDFDLFESHPVTPAERKRLGIPIGTGTLVTLELRPDLRIPKADTLMKRLGRLVSLHDIFCDPKREVWFRDEDRDPVLIKVPKLEGKERLKQSFKVPGYKDATAKLTIQRTSETINREEERFRRGGILIKSRHAVHEATLFDKTLETDPHALRFFGRLVCNYIDDLCVDYDNHIEDEQAAYDPANPMPVLDPSRRSGLTRDHPFVKALFAEALKRLRPLVEEERESTEKQRATVENRTTRKRLDALEQAATKFFDEWSNGSSDTARDPHGALGRRFQKLGYSLSPPYTQLVQGHSIRCTLTVNQSSFPEIESGVSVQMDCLTDEITTDRRFAPLEQHKTKEGFLTATWKVSGLEPSPATGIRIRVGPISDEIAVEVLESEADKYRDVTDFRFQRDSYRLKLGQAGKKVRLFAPITMVPEPRKIDISVDNRFFNIKGEKTLWPRQELGVAVCDLRVRATGDKETTGIITALLGEKEATADVSVSQPLGMGIKIKLEDISHGNQRYRWRQNVLEIATRHKALNRYLKAPPDFDGQNEIHFRVLVAEVVADAVCSKIMGENVLDKPGDYEDADWDRYYAEYSQLMTDFLPVAHLLQAPLS